jgi:hypothetical protein
MRLNVYSQELILNDSDRALELVTKTSDTGVVYSGVRMFLHSSDRLHNTADDDDRSAITFWLPKSRDNRRALISLFSQMAYMVDDAALGDGMDL